MTVALTALYVPGDRPDRFDKAATSGADVVILDLEDAVAPAHKDAARDAVVAWLAARPADGDGPLVQVRVNASRSSWFDADLAAVTASGGRASVRLPKAESVADVDAVVDVSGSALVVHAMLESALGVENAYAIASHPMVATVGLGEADLASDLGVADDAGFAWARSRVIVAARAAGLPAPMMAVYPRLTDDAGLTASCRTGRALGFVGRTAVHPRQLSIILTAFRPSADEVTHAGSVVDALSMAGVDGAGVAVLPSGEMLDAAMLGRAHEVLDREASAAAALARIGIQR